MVVSTTIWANKFASMFRKVKTANGVDDIGLFELCLVELGIKSVASSASSSGMMLEIKAISPLHTGNLSFCSLVPLHGVLPSSIQESTIFRDKFLEGEFVSQANRKHLDQVNPFKIKISNG